MRKRDEMLNPMGCLLRAGNEEMIFVLLARDAAAPVAIRAWAKERIRRGPRVQRGGEAMSKNISEMNTDISILLAQLDAHQENIGEKLESEDAQIVEDIRARHILRRQLLRKSDPSATLRSILRQLVEKRDEWRESGGYEKCFLCRSFNTSTLCSEHQARYKDADALLPLIAELEAALGERT